mmetsp:Transcript_26907/g.81473  ORF Transcript_26907/g.81473 Transcript_26907/m.81473 type:complete len:222 (-) Transcript_26907:383-1048(-)
MLARLGQMSAPLARVWPRRPLRALSSSASAIEERYSPQLAMVHWLGAASFAACIVTVKKAQFTDGPTSLGTKAETKGTLMMLHKSTAVIAGALLIPRVILRLATKLPSHLPLHSPLGDSVDKMLINAGHAALYGALFFMPLSGFAMGYYGGKGVPFYGLFTIPGKTEGRTPEDGKFAGKVFKAHKTAGSILPALLGTHLAGAGVHLLKGQPILSRMSVFSK